MFFNPNFFLLETKLSLKVQARMEDKVRIKNLKSLLTLFKTFGRVHIPALVYTQTLLQVYTILSAAVIIGRELKSL